MPSKRRRAREEKRRHRGGDPPASHRRARQRPASRPRPTAPPRPPSRVFCHICAQNHWTVACPRLRAQPGEYPLMDRRRGCWLCAQRGHTAEQCPVRRYLCRDCGGVHETRACAFAYVGAVWHEFRDPATGHRFYTTADDTEPRWDPPSHERDVVLWHCPNCAVMVPARYAECVQCHRPRPQSAPTDDDDDDDDSSSGDSTSGSDAGPPRKGAALEASSSDSGAFD